MFDGDNSNCTSIVAADANEDDRSDIIIGNAYQHEQVLSNRGNGIFEELSASFLDDSESSNTAVISAADVNGDAYIDLIICSNNDFEQQNQSLVNRGGDGTFLEEIDAFPSYENIKIINSITVADMDGDGRVDILIGTSRNYYPNHLLLNQPR